VKILVRRASPGPDEQTLRWLSAIVELLQKSLTTDPHEAIRQDSADTFDVTGVSWSGRDADGVFGLQVTPAPPPGEMCLHLRRGDRVPRVERTRVGGALVCGSLQPRPRLGAGWSVGSRTFGQRHPTELRLSPFRDQRNNVLAPNTGRAEPDPTGPANNSENPIRTGLFNLHGCRSPPGS
jgi:hypothetical protein